MIQQQAYVLTNITMLLDELMVIVAGYIAYYLSARLSGANWVLPNELFFVSVLAVMFLNNYVFGRAGLYDDKKSPSVFQLGIEISKALGIVFSVLAGFIFVLHRYEYPRIFFVTFAFSCLVCVLINRVILLEYHCHISQKSTNRRKILIVGDMERGEFVSDLLDKQLSWGHEVIGRLSVEADTSTPSIGTINDLHDVLRQQTVDEVVFAIDQTQPVLLGPYINLCKEVGVSVRILPSMWNSSLQNLSVERCQGVPFIIMRAANFGATDLLYKRMLDIVGGAIGTLFFLLIYPLVGLAIKLDSPGPIIFSQQRVGKNGRIFKLYKFRSMYQDAEERKAELLKNNEMNGAIFKMKNDPRITKVGRWLRNTSIDETPQFVNVLAGDMSLVGTRPPTLSEVAAYKDWHLRRISIKPGITGLWQISGRNQITDFNQIVALDCTYFDNWRFHKDILIILKTIVVVLRRKGAL